MSDKKKPTSGQLVLIIIASMLVTDYLADLVGIQPIW